MKWNLSPVETAGVIAVGAGLGLATNYVANQFRDPRAHQLAMLATGVGLYTAGVVIGTNRPAGGWQIPYAAPKQITG
jgi:hypothetical protein